MVGNQDHEFHSEATNLHWWSNFIEKIEIAIAIIILKLRTPIEKSDSQDFGSV